MIEVKNLIIPPKRNAQPAIVMLQNAQISVKECLSLTLVVDFLAIKISPCFECVFSIAVILCFCKQKSRFFKFP